MRDGNYYITGIKFKPFIIGLKPTYEGWKHFHCPDYDLGQGKFEAYL